MSLDTMVDTISQTLLTWFTVSLPAFLLPKLLSFYIFMKTFFEVCKRQSLLSFNALYNSLDYRYIAFFKVNDRYVPVMMNNTDKYTIEPSWIYNMDTQSFTHVESGLTRTKYNFPYIAASVTHNDEAYGDMSEWIMEQSILSNDTLPPLQVLVSAWKYATENIFMYAFNDYKLLVITEDGDELTYDLETEQKVELEPSPEVSNTELEEGEIVEGAHQRTSGVSDVE